MFCYEVYISSVHSIEMFSEKYWNLHGDDIDDSKHVGEGHVGDDEEQCAINTLYTSYSSLLSKVNSSKN